METEYMLTTVDNPFDPFEQFTSWFLFDVEKGYNTCSRIARVVQLSDEMSDQEVNLAISNAIDQLMKYDFMNVYKRVEQKSSELSQ